MANPRLQLRRGTQSPEAANITTALTAEPFFDTTNNTLWVASSSSSFVNIGGTSYTDRVDSFLTAEAEFDGGIVTLKEGFDGGTNKVSIKAPGVLASDVTFQLPANNGTDGYFLKTDGSGVTSWSIIPSGTFSLAADFGTTDSFTNGGTLTFSGNNGIDTTVSDDTITISVQTASDTVKGVASFDATDFTVDSGDVTIKHEAIQDIVGAMVSSNTESGIAVAYDDANGKLDFNVDDFTITLGGDLTGSITVTNLASGTLTATIAADSVALGTDTTGNYVQDVTAGAGLTKSFSASEGQTVDLAIGEGTGITVNADSVQIKNASNLSNTTVTGWNNGQLENSPVTYSGNDVSVAGDLTVTGNDIKSSGGTTAITLNGSDVTIAGNLTVSGTSSVLNTETLKVEDRIIELGLVNGAAPTASTSWDSAVAFNYFATTAKKSAIVWLDNAGFELAATITESAGSGNSDPQITVNSRASLGIASLFIGSISDPANEVITSSKTITNVTFDCGTY